MSCWIFWNFAIGRRRRMRFDFLLRRTTFYICSIYYEYSKFQQPRRRKKYRDKRETETEKKKKKIPTTRDREREKERKDTSTATARHTAHRRP